LEPLEVLHQIGVARSVETTYIFGNQLSSVIQTFKWLLDRLNEVQGVPFEEMARAHGITWDPEPKRNKGLAGKIVEAALGKKPDSASEPDLTYLGIEVKSIPIYRGLEPRENTKITMFNYGDVYDQEWEVSTAYHKLRNTLFVPIVKEDLERPDQWYIRSPFIWMPSLAAEKQLKQEYNEARKRVRNLAFDDLTSKSTGRDGFADWLVPNTAGRDSKDLTTFQINGVSYTSKRRAWMLKKAFTRKILLENVSYRP
jgi:DNA mismatch repair protein MutH